MDHAIRPLLLVMALVLTACGGGGGDQAGDTSTTAAAVDGRAAYAANCAQCHGADLKGTATGPPFLHKVYEPGHHGDDAFRLAVRRGVQPHHWQFGPMPAQPQVDEAEIDAIIRFVRQEQRAAGIG